MLDLSAYFPEYSEGAWHNNRTQRFSECLNPFLGFNLVARHLLGEGYALEFASFAQANWVGCEIRNHSSCDHQYLEIT